jgi:hypothetical protein
MLRGPASVQPQNRIARTDAPIPQCASREHPPDMDALPGWSGDQEGEAGRVQEDGQTENSDRAVDRGDGAYQECPPLERALNKGTMW